MLDEVNRFFELWFGAEKIHELVRLCSCLLPWLKRLINLLCRPQSNQFISQLIHPLKDEKFYSASTSGIEAVLPGFLYTYRCCRKWTWYSGCSDYWRRFIGPNRSDPSQTQIPFSTLGLLQNLWNNSPPKKITTSLHVVHSNCAWTLRISWILNHWEQTSHTDTAVPELQLWSNLWNMHSRNGIHQPHVQQGTLLKYQQWCWFLSPTWHIYAPKATLCWIVATAQETLTLKYGQISSLPKAKNSNIKSTQYLHMTWCLVTCPIYSVTT